MGSESERGWVNPPSPYKNPYQSEPIRINDSYSEDLPMTEATLTTLTKPTTPTEALSSERPLPDLLKRPAPAAFGSDGDFVFEFKRPKSHRGSRHNLTPEATEMRLLKSALECVQGVY